MKPNISRVFKKSVYRWCTVNGFKFSKRKFDNGRAWQPTPVLLSGEYPWTEPMGSQRVGHN